MSAAARPAAAAAQTTYVVLRYRDVIPGDDDPATRPTPVLDLLGSFDADSPQAAIVAAGETVPDGRRRGRYAVVAARNFQTRDRNIRTVEQDDWS